MRVLSVQHFPCLPNLGLLISIDLLLDSTSHEHFDWNRYLDDSFVKPFASLRVLVDMTHTHVGIVSSLVDTFALQRRTFGELVSMCDELNGRSEGNFGRRMS